MEEDSNKTKAYADIILNTARVMLSDRNSAKFYGTKEEALRLLLRMKQMLDSKSVEAEVVLLKKQKEIELLEAQLQEAEEIVTELREELRYVRGKLEKVKVINENNEEQVTVSVQENADKEIDEYGGEAVSVVQNNADVELVVGSLDSNEEVVGGSCLYVTSEALTNESLLLSDDECGHDGKRFDGLSFDISKGSDVCESELDVSIRNKKLELSRNGCAQRIHALEVNEEKQYIAEKDILGNTECLVLALRSMDAEVMITKPLGVKRSSKRGRKNKRWGKRKATSVSSRQSQLIKPCQSQSDFPSSDGEDSMEAHLSVESKEEDALDACKGLEHHLPHKRTLYTDGIGIIRHGKRSKSMVESCKESNLFSINVEYAENEARVPENETGINPVLPLDPGLTDVTICSVKATDRSIDKDLKPRKEDVLVKCEGVENSVVPSTKAGSELVNQHSNSKVIAVVSDSETPRADVNRLLMFTFQRKRKKGSLIGNNDNTSSPGKREVKDKENNAQVPNESTLSNEPSRETPTFS